MRLHRLVAVSLFVIVALPGSVVAAPSQVTVSGHQLIVRKRLADGTLAPAALYVIRGIVWSPASDSTNTSPSDPDNAAVRRAEFTKWVNVDAPLLGTMNVNTVRLMIDPGADATGTAVLDALYAYGIMVIMTVDDAVNNLTRVDRIVRYYKDHPAVLMWSLGNEWNINLYYGVATTVQDAAQRTQTAASLIKSIDSGHPVATSYGDIDIASSGRRLADTRHYVNDVCSSVDVWGLNIYRGNSFGTLFTEWASIASRPMFLGELGTDAFRSAGSTAVGSVDATMQADWDLPLWDEIVGNLSATVPEAVALGGTVFEFNDEWWKVPPAGSQESGGFGGAHPDGFANEEYFGVVDISRGQRAVCAALTTAFDPSYQPALTHSYRVISRGALAAEYPSQYGTAWVFQDGAKLYSATGGGGGGRGFNVAVIDPGTGTLWQPVQHFDTWATRDTGSMLCTMSTFIDSVPNGMLLAMGVADEGGLTQFPPNACQFLSHGCLAGFLQRLAALGSQQISNYCYWDSWVFAAVKGEGVPRAEGRGSGVEVAARTTLPVPTRTLSVALVGNGTVRSVPAGVDCSAACDTLQPLGASIALHAVASSGWTFATWSDDCSGAGVPCSLTMTAARSATATFVSLPLAAPTSLDARFAGAAGAITWAAVPGATGYEVARSADGSTFALIASTTSPTLNDAAVAAGHAYLYRVRALSADGTSSSWSVRDLMTAISFSDDPLVATSTIVRAVHLTELRTAVNAVRALAGLPPATFTDPSPAGGPIRAPHVTELRSALAAARSALGLAALTFTHDTLHARVTPVSAIDFEELRSGVR